MSQNTAAGVSYLTWIAGLIIFLMEKQNRFVRFHAMQSILYNVAFFVVYVVCIVLSGILAAANIPAVGGCLVGLIILAGIVLWVVMLINAFQGKMFKLPVIGDFAERIANQGLS
jgi:uncharacterized membrane protein